jgi:hypothetical protein
VLAQLVLVSRLLGLVNGEQPIEVQVEPSVKRVEILVDGARAATMTGTPWRTIVNFGPELTPHELTAVAYDANNREVARDTQLVNLARPPAEVQLSIEKDAKSGKLFAHARWQHIGAVKATSVTIKLDGQEIGRTAIVPLPQLEKNSLHVLEAEVTFPGAVTARKEIVFGGLYVEQLPTELTSVLVRERMLGKEDPQRCFQLDGRTVPAAALEKVEALVHIVRGSTTTLAEHKLRLPAVPSHSAGQMLIRQFRLPGVTMRFIWPTAQAIRGDDQQSVTNLFLRSDFFDAGKAGTQWILSHIEGPPTKSERFADAVAVAAVQTLRARRRAVLLILGKEEDHSRHAAPAVRRYLQRIGVPLHVWSLVEVTDEMIEDWGDVRLVANLDALRVATNDLRRDLESQRIAWLPVTPLEALRVTAASECAYETVAQPK